MTTPLQLMDPLNVSNELIASLGMDDPGLLVKMDKQKINHTVRNRWPLHCN